MVINTIWTERALSNLETELDYYGEINPALARELSIVITESIKNISTMPGIGRPGKKVSTREFVISRFPYIIAYRVRSEVLEILAIIHQNRKNIRSFY
ncbi:MAG: Addiction module toxin, RelE/StbE [Burkholderiales bacterium]|jgi:plasmid stabilization system protein ParE|nr:Addiction module toxin, RelE/StbE [Burkholderiales bacterium]